MLVYDGNAEVFIRHLLLHFYCGQLNLRLGIREEFSTTSDSLMKLSQTEIGRSMD